ncbi:MAG: cobaltochelatase CobN [Candidatus Endobugula sp.]|jgi:cobaltochelatase CobN
MHLLAAQPGGFTDDEGIIDLGQTSGNIVILSAADSALAGLADSAETLPQDFPSIRLANWMQLLKPAAFDLYCTKVIDHAQVVIVSLLGGESYWQYGVEQLQVWAKQSSTSGQTRHLIIVPGDDTPDEALFSASTVNKQDAIRVWRFLREGSSFNYQHLYYFLASRYLHQPLEKQIDSQSDKPLGKQYPWSEPRSLPRSLLYLPSAWTTTDYDQHSLNDWLQYWCTQSSHRHHQLSGEQINSSPVCALLFYRSHLQSAHTQMFDQLIATLAAHGLRPLPIAISSLKDKDALSLVNNLLIQSKAAIIVNTTGFASHIATSPDLSSEPTTFTSPFAVNIPVLQLILSSSTKDDWKNYSQGLRSRDIAMQIVLPEMDGRIITRAVSFKAEARFSQRCEISVVRYALYHDRARFVAQLAQAHCRLASKKNSEKRIAFILANYPTKDGRIGNGVGLDTPASTIQLLRTLADHGYPVDNIPENGNALITELLGAVTNNPNTLHQRPCWQSISQEDYQHYFSALPENNQKMVLERWGSIGQDPKYRNGRIMLAGIRLGETFIGIQPARGFNMDLLANYHDPDLIPPHSYLAFYFWLRHCYKVDAIIHVGKHGNLEWLPGKGAALSEECWPDIALGPMPHFYPFIVNDPGEGAQAKRRTQAIIIDHLMPPMTRAETYGELAELEGLVDEYYQAMGMDTRRETWLKNEILRLVSETHLLEELSLKEGALGKPTNNDEQEQQVLSSVDTYLCDIKEAQIRHGLHILGTLPETEKLCDTLVALLRLPRGSTPESQGILHNLVKDLQLSNTANNQEGHPDNHNDKVEPFDPLAASTENWQGDKPALLTTVSANTWRTEADTRERLEILAAQCIRDYVLGDDSLNAPLNDYIGNDSITNNDVPNNGHIDNTKDVLAQDVLAQHLSYQLPDTFVLLRYTKTRLLAALHTSAEQETSALITGLNGQFIPPGPSGAPTRGRLDTLPTGRNFFSVDNRSIPSPAAWAIGQLSAQTLIDRHLQEHGDYPDQLGLSVWGTATMRTGGDDIAQAFALMGIKPIWATGSHRVIDFEIMPTMLLGRPRIDVTLRVSGFFRDAFPNVIKLFDAAVLALADFDEPAQANKIKQHIQQYQEQLIAEGENPEIAKRYASYRVFGSKPGAYGAGLQGLIDERCWEKTSDLAEAYVNWGGYAYGASSSTISSTVDSATAKSTSDRSTNNNEETNIGIEGVDVKAIFQHRLSQLDVVAHNQDNREHDILDSDDYYQFQGGMTNAVSVFSGSTPVVYHNDHSNPSAPKTRTLKEELNRVIRSRVLNPKWINAMREHGYKGAFEMAASVDYLFAYDATTNMVDDYQYEKIADALIFNADNRAFMQENNPQALEEMAERLLEATQRGMWNNDNGYGEKLQDLLLDIDAQQEGSHD